MSRIALVEQVETHKARTFAADDAAIADTVLYVDNAVPLYSDSGSVTVEINGDEYQATPTPDDVAPFVTLSPALVGAVAVGDPVTVVPTAETKWATVSFPGEDDLGDPIEYEVPHYLAAYTALADGVYSGLERATVVVETQPAPIVTNVLNQAPLSDAGFLDPDSTVPPAAMTDGLPPASSPTVTLEAFAIGGLRWSLTPVGNADPVRFRIYADTVDPPTQDAAHLVADTGSYSGSFTAIDGARLLPEDPTATIPTYYAAAVEYDADGEADLGASSAGVMPRRATNEDISADYGYFGTIQANQVAAGTFEADLALVGRLSVGNYVEIDGDDSSITIFADAAHTQPLVQLRPSGSIFRGQVIADDISVLNGLILQGTASHIAQSAGITLDASIQDPNTAPVLTSTPATSDWEAVPSGYVSRGFAWDGTQWLRLIRQSGGTTTKVQTLDTSGAVTSVVTLASAGDDVNTIVKLGSSWFVLVASGDVWNLVKYSTAGVKGFVTFVSGNEIKPALGTDGTNILVAFPTDYLGTMRVNIQAFTTSGTFTGPEYVGPTLASIGSTSLSYVGSGSYDFGATRYLIGSATTMRVFSESGGTLTEITAKSFTLADNTYYGGVTWDGSNFYSARTVLHKYNSYYPAASENAYVSYANTDTGTSKHTKDSPLASVALAKRNYVQTALAPAPSGAATPRIYMALGTSTPADTALLLRGEAVTMRNAILDPSVAGGLALVRSRTITNRALTSNVATLTIGTHGYEVGDTVTVASVPTDTFFNGTWILTAVTSTTISYALTHANVSSTASSGTVTNADSNTFGAGAAAWLKSQAGGIELYGDGTAKIPGLVRSASRGRRNTAQSIATSGTQTKVQYDQFTGTALPSDCLSYSAGIFTVTQAGLFNITCYAVFATNATGARRVYLVINGNTYEHKIEPALSGVDHPLTITATDVALGVGDTVEMDVTQSSGGALNLQAGSSISISRSGNAAA